MLIVFLLFIIIGLYGWVYCIKYRFEFDEEKVYLRTIFNKVELNIKPRRIKYR